ncbi:hypothetical protein [Nocardia sp. NBC_00403]|uniref:hypothetical protein n=1 Tax=Nocardia sp. NBC_00403 TaxID=2975990 RepID=UPI002E1D07F5
MARRNPSGSAELQTSTRLGSASGQSTGQAGSDFDGPLGERAGDHRVVDCGSGAEPEHVRHVERVAVDRQGFLENAIRADLLDWMPSRLRWQVRW